MSDKDEAARNVQRRKLTALSKELDIIVRTMDEYMGKVEEYRKAGDGAAIKRLDKKVRDYEKRVKQIDREVDAANKKLRKLGG